MSKRAIGYCRASSSEQAQSGYSLDVQGQRIEAFCFAREWELIGVVKDEGKRICNRNRGGIQRIIRECKEDKFDVVVICTLDRLVRNMNHQTYLAEEAFKKNGVQLCSIDGKYGTSTAKGRLLINVMSSVNQF